MAPAEIVKREGLAQVSDAGQLRQMAVEVLEANPEQVASYQSGKESLIGWFVGQIMARSKGKADPKAVKDILVELLGE